MKCCEDEKNNGKAIVPSESGTETPKKSHNHHSHMLMMVLCCGLPLLVVALIPAMLSINPGLAGVMGKVAPFLCPILMIPMVIMMFRSHKKDHS